MFDPPIFINVRDRVSTLRQLVDWLERAGHQRIVLLDNDSTYPELLEYLIASPHEVVRLGENLGSRSIWVAGLAPDEPYVFTDPDVVPIQECPYDAVQHFLHCLQRHSAPKAGFGLYLDDLPPTFPFRDWEAGPEIQGPHLEPGFRQSLIDTTFALYRPDVKDHIYQGVRTDFPYQARHLSPSWYGGPILEEDHYYLERAIAGPTGSSWAQVA